jgi:iron complex outermembrane receptor protein
MKYSNFLINNKFGKLSLFALMLAQGLPVQAQVLEEVVVTAQRREQSLQEVPISIDVTSGEELENQGFRNLAMMSGFVPSLRIDADRSGNEENMQVRGVGTSGTVLAYETAVPIFTDGIIFGRRSQLHSAFFDIERVEVLRGPQPVFFGQNATAGAISITTRKANLDNANGYILGEAGNNGVLTTEAAYGMPLTDNFAVRVAGKYDRTEGYSKDFITGEKFPAGRNMAARLSSIWTPMENLTITSRLEISDVENELRAEQAFGGGTSGAGLDRLLNEGLEALTGVVPKYPYEHRLDNIAVKKSGGNFIVNPINADESFGVGRSPSGNIVDLTPLAGRNDLPEDVIRTVNGEFYNLDGWNAATKIEYVFNNDIALESTTAYVESNNDYMQEFSAAQPFMTAPLSRFDFLKQISQEFRLTSPSGGQIEWMAGVYGQWNHRDQGAMFIHAAWDTRVLPGPRRTNAYQDSTWLTAFGTVTFNFMDDRAAIDIGARVSNVKNTARHTEWTAEFIDENGSSDVADLVDGARITGITAFHKGKSVYDTLARGTLINTGGIGAGCGGDAAAYKDNCDSNSITNFDPQVVLRYNVTDDVSLYAKYAEAFKAGSFDTSVVSVVGQADFAFAPEFAKNWELGAKGTFWDGRMTFNGTLFWTTVKDLQRSAFDEAEGRSRTTNLGKQRVRGIEFNGDILATERFRISYSGAIMDGEVVSYPGDRCTLEERALSPDCVGGLIDRSGEKALFTPDWDFNVMTTYTLPVMDSYEASLITNIQFTDGYFESFDKTLQWDQTENVSLTLNFGPQDGSWQVSAYGRNLGEPKQTYHPEADFNSNGESTALGPTSFITYGVQGRVMFD